MEKDRPLVLRRRADRQVTLLAPWPARHQFSTRWLVQAAADGVVAFEPAGGDVVVVVSATNGRARYRVDAGSLWGVAIEREGGPRG